MDKMRDIVTIKLNTKVRESISSIGSSYIVIIKLEEVAGTHPFTETHYLPPCTGDWRREFINPTSTTEVK